MVSLKRTGWKLIKDFVSQSELIKCGMKIVVATKEHVEDWATLRAMFWNSTNAQDHASELIGEFLSGTSGQQAFIAFSEQGAALGFAEMSLRRDYVPGCISSPTLFLEGIFVHPTYRRKGVARGLLAACKDRGRQVGCVDFASNAALDNHASRAFHTKLGFGETEKVVYFHQSIKPK